MILTLHQKLQDGYLNPHHSFFWVLDQDGWLGIGSSDQVVIQGSREFSVGTGYLMPQLVRRWAPLSCFKAFILKYFLRACLEEEKRCRKWRWEKCPISKQFSPPFLIQVDPFSHCFLKLCNWYISSLYVASLGGIWICFGNKHSLIDNS